MCRMFRPFDAARWPKWFLVGAWGPLLSMAVACLFGASASHFPGGYDWRYEVMCRLGYTTANPGGCAYWSWALTLTCVMGAPCCGYFHARLRGASPGISSFARATLAAGLAAGFVIGLDGIVIPKLNGIAYKLHEGVATFAFAAIFFGVIGFWLASLWWLRLERRWTWSACALLSVFVAFPFAGAMVSQAYLFFVPNDLGWVGREWAEQGVPVWLSFAFWEWVAIGGIYVSLYVMAFLLPAEPDARAV